MNSISNTNVQSFMNTQVAPNNQNQQAIDCLHDMLNEVDVIRQNPYNWENLDKLQQEYHNVAAMSSGIQTIPGEPSSGDLVSNIDKGLTDIYTAFGNIGDPRCPLDPACDETQSAIQAFLTAIGSK